MNITMDATDVEDALSQKSLNNCAREAITKVADHWRKKYQPLHFGTAAANRYHEYKPRRGQPGSGRTFRGSYAARKSRKGKANRPLEFTGAAKRDTESNRRIKATATRGVASVRITFSRIFNLRHKLSQVKMADEITATIPAELEDLTTVYVKEMDALLQNALKKNTKKK